MPATSRSATPRLLFVAMAMMVRTGFAQPAKISKGALPPDTAYTGSSILDNSQNVSVTAPGVAETQVKGFRFAGGDADNAQVIGDTLNITLTLLQKVVVEETDYLTGTTQIPDDSQPLATEGDEYIRAAITPMSTTSMFEIDVQLFWAHDAVSGNGALSLHQDGGDSIGVAGESFLQDTLHESRLHHTLENTVGISETTFLVRAGASVAGEFAINGANGGQLYGGFLKSRMTVRELEITP